MKFWITLATLCVANLAFAGPYGIRYIDWDDTTNTVMTTSDSTVMSAQFALKAPLASPTFTGTATMANMRYGAAGYSISFYACGIDTFVDQAQVDTITVTNIPAGAIILWGSQFHPDSTALSGNTSAGARTLSTGINGQVIVRRLNASGTYDLVYYWQVTK